MSWTMTKTGRSLAIQCDGCNLRPFVARGGPRIARNGTEVLNRALRAGYLSISTDGRRRHLCPVCKDTWEAPAAREGRGSVEWRKSVRR